MENVKKEKKKKIITIALIVFIVLLLVSAGTYAYWTWVTAENERTNVTLSIEAPDMSARLTGYTQNITNLIPVSSCTDPQYAIKKELTLTYENLSTNTGAILGTLKIENFTSPYGTPDANDLSHLHYAVTKSLDNCTAEPLEGMSGTFTETSGNLFTSQLLAGPIPTGTESGSQTYYLWVWLDSEYTHQNVGSEVTNDPMQDISFTLVWEGEIKNDAYEYTGADGKFKYVVLENSEIQISKYLGSETEVVIPATYDGYQVYSVGNIDATSAKATRYNIFNTIGNTTVTSVTVEDGVEEIKLGAFDRCSGMTTLSLPDSVTLIDDYAFYQCTKLSGTLDLPSNLVELGRLAFSGDTKITGELVIPNTVTTMDIGAFQSCSSLTSLTFEENSTLTSIPQNAFSGCSNLSGELVLPDTITSIDQQAFYELDKLTGDLVIPNSVTSIGKAAFQGCEGFDGELTLSNSLVHIEDYAFNHCSGFTNTTLAVPSTLQKIGSIENNATHVFYDFATKTIEEYTINGSKNGIGTKFKVVDGVLYTTDGTRMSAYPASKVGNSYVMPEGVTTIDELAFSRAGSSYSGVPDTGIKSLTLPNSYVISQTLPSNYANVGHTLTTALYLYTGVNEILVKDNNPNYKSTDGILYSKDGTELWYIPHAKTGDITLPNTLTTIRSGSLALGRLAATSLYIPASVTNIEATAILEINQLLIDNNTSVTFDPNCVYQINASNRVEKTS